MKTIFEKSKQFIEHDVWHIDHETLPKMRALAITWCKVFIIVVKGFIKDNCTLHASALTNISIMSMVPMMAFMFAMAKGFGAYEKVKEIINSWLKGQSSGLNDVITKLMGMVDKTDFKAIGIVGVIVVFWTVLSTMGKIENTFNAIWGVKQARDFLTKCKEYFITLIIVPITILAASAINASISSPQIEQLILEKFSALYVIYLTILPLVSPLMVAFAFTYLYKFLPNTKVFFKPAFMAGIITTIMWSVTQWAYIKFQVGVSNAGAIYGTFASIPLFLAWLYTSWLIIIFGAEVSFAFQNYRSFEDESREKQPSFQSRLDLGFVIIKDIAESFYKGKNWHINDFLHRKNAPSRLTHGLLSTFIDCHILNCIDAKDSHYAPAKDLSQMSLFDIEEAIKGGGDEAISRLPKEDLDAVRNIHDTESSHIQKMKDKTIIDFIQK